MKTKNFAVLMAIAMACGVFAAERAVAADDVRTVVTPADLAREKKDLKSRDAKKRVSAAKNLARSGNKEAASSLLGQLKNEKETPVKVHLIYALGQAGGSEASSNLKALAKEDKSDQVRMAACAALGTLRDDSSVTALAGILNNTQENESVRLTAASSLTFYLYNKEAGDALGAALKNGSYALKFGIVNSLRHTAGTKAGTALLKTAANDTDKEISGLAQELLEQNGITVKKK